MSVCMYVYTHFLMFGKSQYDFVIIMTLSKWRGGTNNN